MSQLQKAQKLWQEIEDYNSKDYFIDDVVQRRRKAFDKSYINSLKAKASQHLEDCKDWLNDLKELNLYDETLSAKQHRINAVRIVDLQDTIAFYESKGVMI